MADRVAKIVGFDDRLDGNVRRWMAIEAPSGVSAPEPIYFEFVGHSHAQPPSSFDGFVQGVVLWAMAAKVDLEVKGPMSREALVNLEEYQTAFANIFPDRYFPIRITPETIVDRDSAPAPAAISLFSGGADGMFTLLRHQGGHLGVKARSISAILMIHHLDLDNFEAQISDKLTRTRPFLEAMGVETHVQRTNLRRNTGPRTIGFETGQIYIETFGAQLCASLHQYSHQFGYGLMGSNEPYSAPVPIIGSTPAIDWMLSTDTMRIVHDGAGFSRTEKIAAIAQHPIARKVLHVCLAHPSQNCGRCMKCVRTQMNFLAAGYETPECMPGPLELDQIDEIRIRHVSSLNELRLLLHHAKKHGNTGPWSRRLEKRLQNSGRGSISVQGKQVKRALARSISKRLEQFRDTVRK